MSSRRLVALAAAAAMLASSFGFAADDSDAVAAMIKKYNVQEDSMPVRQRKDWRVPKKMVVVGGVIRDAERDKVAKLLPGTDIVYVPDTAAAVREVKDADIIVGQSAHPGACEPEILNAGKQLRWIMAYAAGVERCVSVPSVRERKLLITNLRGMGSAAIGEHAIALALAMAHGLDTFVNNQAKERWSREDAAARHIRTLTGKTMLVVGLGGIGTEVASRAHGLGMKVIATRARGHEGPEYVSHVGSPDELMKLAATADVIVSCVPLTAETKNIYDKKFFAALKPTAYFVNVARAGSVVASELIAALKEGRLAGAGLDVVDPEPLPPGNPLWKAPNVIITPHMSSSSDIPNEAIPVLLKENLRRYVAGEKMLSVVDLEREY
jgi:phosphoglycerate dehydrogenase-like enzyme